MCVCVGGSYGLVLYAALSMMPSVCVCVCVGRVYAAGSQRARSFKLELSSCFEFLRISKLKGVFLLAIRARLGTHTPTAASKNEKKTNKIA